MALKTGVKSLVRALSLPFRLPAIVRDRVSQQVLQNHQIIGKLDRITARIDRFTNPDQPLLDNFPHLVPGKRELIDTAFESVSIQSFADLGGAFAHPPGGYSLYTMDKYKVPVGLIVDNYAPDGMEEQISRRQGLRFVRGNFALPAVAAEVGPVDAIYLLDVLCMQAKPGWRELLATYAHQTQCMLISSAQFDCFPQSLRLMDLSEDEYYECVPREYAVDARAHNLFAIRDEIDPMSGGKHRDSPRYWQCAITDRDLIDTMHGLNFRLADLKPLFKMDNIPKPGVETRGFIFVKR